MDAHMLDGNAVAGLLQQIFAVEMTTAIGTCTNCGANEPVGAVRVYRGAGFVLRCPHCDHVLGTIASGDTETWFSMRGIRTLRITRQ